MIRGVHALIYTEAAEEVRAFFRDVLEFPSLDSGGGWLIFGLPPAELGIHPAEGRPYHELWLMCDDIYATAQELRKNGVELARPIAEADFGLTTAIRLPGGSELGLYQPKHPTVVPKGN
jgi:predicted enzyme related to lactoylglutathione lyase